MSAPRMSNYVRIPLEIEPADVVEQMVLDMQARVPGWVPARGNLDVAIIEVTGLQHAILQEQASGTTDSIYRYLGASLFGVAPEDETFAVADSTWTLTAEMTPLGLTIPAGTEVKKEITGSESIGFAVLEDVTIAPGAGTSAAGGVQLVALEAGAAGSGLTGTMLLVTPLDGVSAVTIVGVTQGGRDAEEDAAYLDRLTRRLRRLTFGLVLPADVEDAARDIDGIARALVIDNFIPPSTTGAAAALTVVPIDEAGLVVSSGIKATLIAELEASREQGFLFSVMDPTYTAVNVAFNFTTYDGFEAAVVKVAAEAAVADYLSPATWGLPTFGDQPLWIQKTKVRYLEVGSVLNAVEGLDEVDALTLNGSANTDVTLAGVAPLPTAGTIVGTAV